MLLEDIYNYLSKQTDTAGQELFKEMVSLELFVPPDNGEKDVEAAVAEIKRRITAANSMLDAAALQAEIIDISQFIRKTRVAISKNKALAADFVDKQEEYLDRANKQMAWDMIGGFNLGKNPPHSGGGFYMSGRRGPTP